MKFPFNIKKLSENVEPKKLGTFGGVFTPDVLTILGVIMYLRLGWVVGNAGIVGAIAIIVLAKMITIATGLSMSSITTNIKIGAGGAYSIIARSLGLEAGGSVGIPFYVSQTLSAALYIIGFSEGWLFIFPAHDPIIVNLVVWIAIMGISFVSAHFAIKVQYVIMVIIGLSIFSFLLSEPQNIHLSPKVGTFNDAGFWEVFAIFFPAVTGIMAGANLSGDLKNPRKAIPQGTLSAILVTMVIYLGLAIALAEYISPEELRSNQMAMVDHSYIPELVLAGILAATFSSALGSVIGAPRILQALAEQKSVPASRFFVVKSKNNEPRNAMAFTSFIILTALLFGNLNALASLITMFFLITYGTLNIVVYIQQSMKIISFRPTFKIPHFVPLIGGLGCLFIMLLINPIFSVISFAVIIALYVYLTKRGLESEWGDIRGGMFLALAEKAARIAAKFPSHQITWKPDILLPVEDPTVWAGPLLFINNIIYPSGSLYAFSVKAHDREKTVKALNEITAPLLDGNMHIHSTVLEDEDFLHGAKLFIQTLQGAALKPNTLFLTLSRRLQKDEKLKELISYASSNGLGIIVMRQHERTAFGMQKTINLWLRDKSPNWHLAILIALQLQMNWEGRINLVTVAAERKDIIPLRNFLEDLSNQTRLPSLTEFHVLRGTFNEALNKAPRADINIFGIGEDIQFDSMRRISEGLKSSSLFIRDSGRESAEA